MPDTTDAPTARRVFALKHLASNVLDSCRSDRFAELKEAKYRSANCLSKIAPLQTSGYQSGYQPLSTSQTAAAGHL